MLEWRLYHPYTLACVLFQDCPWRFQYPSVRALSPSLLEEFPQTSQLVPYIAWRALQTRSMLPRLGPSGPSSDIRWNMRCVWHYSPRAY